MIVRKEIAKRILKELKEYYIHFKDLDEFQQIIEKSISKTEKEWGEYTLKLAFNLTRILKKKSLEIAQIISDKLLTNTSLFQNLTVVQPGFINIILSQSFKKEFIKNLYTDTLKPLKNSKPKKILIEYVSANPTGPLHIGHGRWAVIGSVLAKILTFSGNNVHEEFYVNDAGQQIKNLKKSVDALRKNIPLPEDGYHGEYLKKYKDENINVVEDILKKQKIILKKIKVENQRFFREKTLYQNNQLSELMENLVKKGFAYKKDGALWFSSSKSGDGKDRVLVKSNGDYTYFAVDVAYHYNKVKRGFNLLIDILGADHHGYIKRIEGAVKLLTADKVSLKVLIGQNVSLKEKGESFKMSKRAGNLITLEEVTAKIPVEVIRYFFSMRHMNTPLDFDLEIAKKESLENPIYYIQYAYVRISSVLKKAEKEKLSQTNFENFNEKIFSNLNDINPIIIQMMEFKSILIKIAENYEIHLLNNYLYELSEMFHALYNKVNFTRQNNEEEKEFSRNILFILSLIKKILKKGLDLLSIETKFKM